MRSIANFHVIAVMNVLSDMNAMQQKNAVTHFSAGKVLLMPIALVRLHVKTAETNRALLK
jgi:cytochrome b561